jgi:hypothetical protein
MVNPYKVITLARGSVMAASFYCSINSCFCGESGYDLTLSLFLQGDLL